MQKVLITGVSGLVGSYLLPLLSDYEVHGISRYPISVNLNNYTHFTFDLGEEIPFNQLPQKIDTIVYLAQSENFREFPEKALNVFQINTSQVIKMADYGKRAGARTFIYASSGGVYGSSLDTFSEDFFIPARGNIGFYLSTKLCTEILLENYAPFMNINLLRLFFVYGKGQKRSMLIPRLVDNVKEGRPISLQGEVGLRINPVHASDAAKAIVASIKQSGCHRINVAGPETLSLKEIAEIIGNKVGRMPLFEMNDTQPQNLIGDLGNMKKYLCNPKVKFEEGVLDIL